MPDWGKMIVLLLAMLFVLDAVFGDMIEAFIERGKQVAIAHGCRSPKCVQFRWWFSSTPAP